MLDAGAGERRIQPLFTHNTYVSQDFAAYAGGVDTMPPSSSSEWDRTWDSGSCDIICDIVSIPRPSESFDLITLLEVVEHLPDPAAAIQELARLLKPGGSLLITCPNLCAEHQTPYFYYSGFSRYFFQNLLQDSTGLQLTSLVPQGDFISAHFSELRQLLYASSSKIITLPLLLTLVGAEKFVRFLTSIGHVPQPVSCSGWSAVYTKQ